MPFGTATVVTNLGKAKLADRVRVSPSGSAPKWAAMGKGATGGARTASAADTVLTTETEQRVAGTESVTTVAVTNDAYQNVGTIVATTACSTSAQSIDEAGLFDASSSGGGNMFTSATFPVQSLNPGDSLQFSWKVQLS